MLLLDQPLEWTHLGTLVKVAGSSRVVDMRAEVAVLTRNVVVEGDAGSAQQMYGATVAVSGAQGGVLRMEGVQVRSAGQAWQQGRWVAAGWQQGRGCAVVWRCVL
jgi:hypothetical protein